MKIIVDTCVWSLALRRKIPDQNNPTLQELTRLIHQARIQMLGPIRQEILSGIAIPEQYTKLQTYLANFRDLSLISQHHEQAAEFYNLCRKQGIQTSAIDVLICAISAREQMPIFTIDQDFVLLSTVLPIHLYSP